MTTSSDEAPGWDAIDAAIAPLVADTAPLHWGTGTAIPDQSGIWGISAYDRGDHWFLITYGLSELFTKVTDVPEVSGWGEELTMRIARSGEEAPPSWAPKFLARLGELVFEQQTPYLPGGRLKFQDADDGIPPAVAWEDDPELPDITTLFGAVRFVTTVGVSRAVLERMRSSTTAEVLATIRVENPLLITGGPGLTW